MRRAILILIISIPVNFLSCKKDYVCQDIEKTYVNGYLTNTDIINIYGVTDLNCIDFSEHRSTVIINKDTITKISQIKCEQ